VTDSNELFQLQPVQRLSQLIQRGECVLFLGAGVSMDSGTPTGQGLADEIGTSFFGTSPDTYTLDIVSEMAADEGRRALNEWLRDRFIDLEPKGALLSLPNFRWKSIYTVNFDTLVEKAYERAPTPAQKIRTFYSDKDQLTRLKPGEVPFYKLHGCITRANTDDGRLVLTQDDFAQARKVRQRLFARLIDDVSDYTVFYVGFRRNDVDFRQVLLEIEEAAGHLTEIRRSYALQPHFTDVEARFWDQKRVALINSRAGDFFDALEANFSPEQRVIDTSEQQKEIELPPLIKRKPMIPLEVLQDAEQNFEIIDERAALQEPNIADFFLGAPPNWGTIAAGVDAARTITDEILNAVLIDILLDRHDAQFVLLHAEAGSGKATILKRLGLELALTWDRVVLALKPYGTLDFLVLERLAQATRERVYVLVNDASSMAREISEVMKNARQAKTKLTIIAKARTNEWGEAHEGYTFPVIEEFELGPLNRSEIDALLERLEQNNALGLLTGASHEAQVAAFEAKADRQLLVALREATEGKRFDEIVVNEYDRIPSPDGHRAYLLVAAMHNLGIFTRAGLLRRALDIPFVDLKERVFDPTTKVIVSRDVLGEDEQYYSTRHQLIANIVFDRKIGSERLRLQYYSNLIKDLDIGYLSDADAYRKLTRGKNKQLLREFRTPANRREIMRQLINVDPSDALAYQHAAMMELDENNVETAAKHLNKAIELRPGDPAIRDTEGQLALKSAISEQNVEIANAKYAKAEEIFRRNVQRRKDEPYGYRHLAETYIRWAEHQLQDEKRLEYIALAYQVLIEGLSKCLSKSMLLQYLGEIEATFGDADKARRAFGRALVEKPGAIMTRFMAARLEEREGNPEQALQILEQGLTVTPQDFELHYRIATLLAMLHPERDKVVRSHFEAALLGPLRDYRPRLAYGAYLFSQKDFSQATEQFTKLDATVVSSKERFEMRKFPYGSLTERQNGRVKNLSFNYSDVEFSQGAVNIFFSLRQLPKNIRYQLHIGSQISFEIAFNLKGPVATAIQLD